MPSEWTFTLPLQPTEPQTGYLNMGGSNPAGDKISVNSRWLEWNGRPWLPIMGEFHYARCHEGLWEDELRKIKAGGIGLQLENEDLSTAAPWATTHLPDTEWTTAGAGGVKGVLIENIEAIPEYRLRVRFSDLQCSNETKPI